MMQQGMILESLLAIAAGILIFAVPRLLNHIVAGFFLLKGVAGLVRAAPGLPAESVVALVAGILILIFPRLLNYVVAGALIFMGLAGVFPGH